MVQLAPTVRLAAQLLAKANSDAFVPVTAMLLICNTALPVLVSVTDCDSLGVFATTEPNARLFADRLTNGSTPVPLNAILCGELVSLSVTVTVAVIAPVAVGAKCPWMLQLDPAARLDPQLLPNTN